MPSSGFQTCALRSEEHTSELQSHDNIVCRLLLEKISESPILRDSTTSGCMFTHLSVRIRAASPSPKVNGLIPTPQKHPLSWRASNIGTASGSNLLDSTKVI